MALPLAKYHRSCQTYWDWITTADPLWATHTQFCRWLPSTFKSSFDPIRPIHQYPRLDQDFQCTTCRHHQQDTIMTLQKNIGLRPSTEIAEQHGTL